MNIDDLLQVINNWGKDYTETSCENAPTRDVGQLASVNDCMDAATNKGLTPFSLEWVETVNACTTALCEAQILVCD